MAMLSDPGRRPTVGRSPGYLRRLLESRTFVAVAAFAGPDVVGGLAGQGRDPLCRLPGRRAHKAHHLDRPRRSASPVKDTK